MQVDDAQKPWLFLLQGKAPRLNFSPWLLHTQTVATKSREGSIYTLIPVRCKVANKRSSSGAHFVLTIQSQMTTKIRN